MCCQVMIDSLTTTVQQRVAKLGLLVCFAPSDLNSNRRAISLQDCLLAVQNRKVLVPARPNIGFRNGPRASSIYTGDKGTGDMVEMRRKPEIHPPESRFALGLTAIV